MLTLIPDAISPGFVYQSAVYRFSDDRTLPCRVAYHQKKGDGENQIEFYGSIVELRPLGELTGEALKKHTPSGFLVKKANPAFIRCNNLFLFAPKLVVERDVSSDLLIEGDWKLQELVRTEMGEELILRECGEECYSCSFTEMFRL